MITVNSERANSKHELLTFSQTFRMCRLILSTQPEDGYFLQDVRSLNAALLPQIYKIPSFSNRRIPKAACCLLPNNDIPETKLHGGGSHGGALTSGAQRRRGARVATRQQWLPPESQ
jgi:hypothetical protein